MSKYKKDQAVSVIGTKTNANRRQGKFVAEHPSAKGSFFEILLDGSTATAKFRGSQVMPA